MKPAHLAAVAFFVILACLQALRLVLGWEVEVNGMTIPLWPSGVAVVVLLALATALYREARRPAS